MRRVGQPRDRPAAERPAEDPVELLPCRPPRAGARARDGPRARVAADVECTRSFGHGSTPTISAASVGSPHWRLRWSSGCGPAPKARRTVSDAAPFAGIRLGIRQWSVIAEGELHEGDPAHGPAVSGRAVGELGDALLDATKRGERRFLECFCAHERAHRVGQLRVQLGSEPAAGAQQRQRVFGGERLLAARHHEERVRRLAAWDHGLGEQALDTQPFPRLGQRLDVTPVAAEDLRLVLPSPAPDVSRPLHHPMSDLAAAVGPLGALLPAALVEARGNAQPEVLEGQLEDLVDRRLRAWHQLGPDAPATVPPASSAG